MYKKRDMYISNLSFLKNYSVQSVDIRRLQNGYRSQPNLILSNNITSEYCRSIINSCEFTKKREECIDDRWRLQAALFSQVNERRDKAVARVCGNLAPELHPKSCSQCWTAPLEFATAIARDYCYWEGGSYRARGIVNYTVHRSRVYVPVRALSNISPGVHLQRILHRTGRKTGACASATRD